MWVSNAWHTQVVACQNCSQINTRWNLPSPHACESSVCTMCAHTNLDIQISRGSEDIGKSNPISTMRMELQSQRKTSARLGVVFANMPRTCSCYNKHETICLLLGLPASWRSCCVTCQGPEGDKWFHVCWSKNMREACLRILHQDEQMSGAVIAVRFSSSRVSCKATACELEVVLRNLSRPRRRQMVSCLL